MLTWAERLILYNQNEILKLIDPDNKSTYEERQEIVSNGYEQYYNTLNPCLYPETISKEVTGEVEEIFDMFRAITSSCEKLKFTPKSRGAKFEGFDGNAGGGHYGIARFIRHTQRRWEELADCPDNSHSSISLASYRAKVARWKKLGRSFELTAAQIEEIAG